ncbi:hypothetical protein BDY19DRAFT_995916 [Irpex rosettiformis]|uniref:Uncharacterized protein n=1 Tax=Irpex rosettiformis TaxID=378272 RepID=A0ACB8TWJ2_9APHY|nr:hypothetical protein BDY19DRAFT_995916 [Irpex rosettiformis]
MAPINIPGHVAQGPTLAMAPLNTPEDTTQDVTSTPWIFWVMMTLVGTLVISFFGYILFVLAKRSAAHIIDTVVYYASAVKNVGALSKCIGGLKRKSRALSRRLYTKTSKKSKDILPTSLDPYTFRPLVLPNLKVSLTMPARSFGSSIREKVHDMQGGVLRKVEDRTGTRETKVQAIHVPNVTVNLQAPSKIHDSRPTRNHRETRIPSWVQRLLKWKPEQGLPIPEIRIWGPGEEPPSSNEQQQVRSEPTLRVDCTTKELMEYYGIDDAAIEAICKKPWTIYKPEPRSREKRTDEKDQEEGDTSKKGVQASGTLDATVIPSSSYLALPCESAAPHHEERPDSERFSLLGGYKGDSSVLTTPPLSPDPPSMVLDDGDNSSDGSCSPSTPDAATFNDAVSSVPEIRIIEPSSPERISHVDTSSITDAIIYGILPPSPSAIHSSPSVTFKYCYPDITSLANICHSPPLNTPPLSSARIPISLSPTLSPACYLQLPPDMSRASKKRAKALSSLENTGTMFKLAALPRRRPLIFAPSEGGIAQSVGMGREGVKKTKDKVHHGLGLSGMPLGGIQEVEESEEDDEQVATRVIEHTPSVIPAQETSTGYLATDGTTHGCSGRLHASALQPPIRKSNIAVEPRTLDLRPVTNAVRTSTSSRRVPSLPNQLCAARPRFSVSRSSLNNSPSPDKGKKNGVVTRTTEGRKVGNGSLTRSSSTPLRSITNTLSSRDTPTAVRQRKLDPPSTPPLPSHRFTTRSESLSFSPRPKLSPRIASTITAKAAVPATTRSSPSTPKQLPRIPQASPPSGTRSRKVVTKPPVPRYRPSDT